MRMREKIGDLTDPGTLQQAFLEIWAEIHQPVKAESDEEKSTDTELIQYQLVKVQQPVEMTD